MELIFARKNINGGTSATRVCMKPKVLVVSRDVPLLRTRNLILGTFFSVCTAGTLREARNLIEQNHFDLLVLCHSFTHEEGCQLATFARQRRSPVKILATSALGNDVKPWADAQIGLDRGPYGLMQACVDVLGFRLQRKARF